MTICELVIGDIQKRAQLGMERYGRPLPVDDLKVALLNAYEECLDQAIYLKQTLESMRQAESIQSFKDAKAAEVADAFPAMLSQDVRINGEAIVGRIGETGLTCAKCGAVLETRRHKGQHERRCDGTLPVIPPVYEPAIPHACSKCGKVYKFLKGVTKHEALCGTGRKTWKKPLYKSGSECHGADVYKGPSHVYGYWYCSKCTEPCRWRAGPLPADVRPAPKRELSAEEKDMLETVRGSDDEF